MVANLVIVVFVIQYWIPSLLVFPAGDIFDILDMTYVRGLFFYKTDKDLLCVSYLST